MSKGPDGDGGRLAIRGLTSAFDGAPEEFGPLDAGSPHGER